MTPIRNLVSVSVSVSVAVSVALASLSLAACSSPPSAAPAQPKGPTRWALLMYERNDAWARMPAAQRDIEFRKYLVWIKDLESRGIFKHGTQLGRGGARIAPGARGEPYASPIDPDAESLTGIFIIETTNPAEAERIAATCPALGHGETIHVRPVNHLD